MSRRSVLFGGGIVVVIGGIVGFGLMRTRPPAVVPAGPSGATVAVATVPEVLTVANAEPQTAPSPAHPPIPSSAAHVEIAPAPRRIPNQYLYPNDTGGFLTRQVLAPTAPPLPALPSRTKPLPRRSALERAEFPLPRAALVVPSLPVESPPLVRLTPPGETVPANLGRGAEADLRTIRLPSAPK